MPYAVEVPLVHLLVHRTVYGNLPRFRGVLKLTMIPFCGIQVPSVVFKHLDDLLRFICLHIYSALIHTAKVTKLIPPAKQLSRKVFDLILFNNILHAKHILIIFASKKQNQDPPRYARVLNWFDKIKRIAVMLLESVCNSRPVRCWRRL